MFTSLHLKVKILSKIEQKYNSISNQLLFNFNLNIYFKRVISY